MQYTGSFRTVSRTGVQVAIVAAVAVTGIAIGRWGVPAEDSATVVDPSTNVSRSDRFESIAAEQKLAKMDAAEARYSTTATVTEEASDAEGSVDRANVAAISASLVDRKFAQMDAAEARYSTVVSPQADANRTTDRYAERKLAQMDAAEARYSTNAVVTAETSEADVLVDAANVAPIPQSAAGTVDRGKDRLEMKFAQMDADEAR